MTKNKVNRHKSSALTLATLSYCDNCLLWHLSTVTIAFCLCLLCLLSHLPTLILAYSYTCLLSNLPTLKFAYSQICQLSHLPTLTLANSHTCLLTHLPTLKLAYSHTCLPLNSLRTQQMQSVTDRQTGLLTNMVTYRDANVVYNSLNTYICASLPSNTLKNSKKAKRVRQMDGPTDQHGEHGTRILLITH